MFTKTVTHEVFVPVGKQCLSSPPPEKRVLPAATVIQGGADDCPKTYDACVKAEATNIIFQTVKELRQYVEDAWTLCGPPPAKPSPTP